MSKKIVIQNHRIRTGVGWNGEQLDVSSASETKDRAGEGDVEKPSSEQLSLPFEVSERPSIVIPFAVERIISDERMKQILDSQLKVIFERHKLFNGLDEKRKWITYDVYYDSEEFNCIVCHGNCIRRRMCCHQKCRLICVDNDAGIIWTECFSRRKIVGHLFVCEANEFFADNLSVSETTARKGITYSAFVLHNDGQKEEVKFNLYGCTQEYNERLYDPDNCADARCLSDDEHVFQFEH